MREKRHRFKPQATQLARDLRKEMTVPERKLWYRLRRRQLDGLRFRRQQVFGPYIVDFYCAEENLVVEVDGITHIGRDEEDAARTTYLEAQGLRVIRVTNDDVLKNMESVLLFILRETGRLRWDGSGE